jgi:hypothetical protein
MEELTIFTESPLLLILLIITLCTIFALLMSSIAVDKGHKAAPAFFLVFFFNILGMLYVIALPDLVAREQREAICNMLFVIKQRQNAGNGSDPISISTEPLAKLDNQ